MTFVYNSLTQWKARELEGHAAARNDVTGSNFSWLIPTLCLLATLRLGVGPWRGGLNGRRNAVSPFCAKRALCTGIGQGRNSCKVFQRYFFEAPLRTIHDLVWKRVDKIVVRLHWTNQNQLVKSIYFLIIHYNRKTMRDIEKSQEIIFIDNFIVDKKCLLYFFLSRTVNIINRNS